MKCEIYNYFAECRLPIEKTKNWIPAGVYTWFIQVQEWQEKSTIANKKCHSRASGNPLIKSKRARNEIIGRGDPVWSPENDNQQMAIDN